MANQIVTTSKRPRAIARESNGIVLYWVEELRVAGLSFKGIGRLLECDDRTVANLIKGTEVGIELEAETVTEGGIQALKLITEESLAAVLTTAVASKCKSETRKNAAIALTKLAAAGFKLMVMLELAPHQLKAQVDQHVSQIDKEIELQRLKNEGVQLQSALVSLHGRDVALRLMGDKDALVETRIKTTEVVDPATGYCAEILTADQLKLVVKQRTGKNLKTMKQFTDALRLAGRDDLLVPVTRHTTSEYCTPGRLDEALDVVYGKERQRLVGE